MDAIQISFRRARGLFFDLDGTLVESHEANFQALYHALERQGVALSWEEYAQIGGLRTTEQGLAMARRSQSPLDIARLIADRDAFYLDHLELVRVRAEVAAIAERHAGRLPLAVVTGSPAATALPTLRELRLARLFPVVVTGDDVERGKPAPDGYRLAAARAGVHAKLSVAYEDSDEGLAAACAAGMATIDVRALAAVA